MSGGSAPAALRRSRASGSELTVTHRSQIAHLPGKLLHGGADISRRIILAPWRLLFTWTAWGTGWVLSLLAMVDFLPYGFVPASKVQELTRILDHMHSREDSYRTTIRELQDNLDSQMQDKKKALRKLKRTLYELDHLHEELGIQATKRALTPTELEALSTIDSLGAPPAPPHPIHIRGPSKLGLHFSVAVLAFAVWWFYSQTQPAIQRKILFAILFPLVWVYVAMLQGSRATIVPLYCACWFVTGFIAAHRFSQGGCVRA